MQIGSRIKNLRLQKNLTQEELAERTDLTKGYISQVERDLSMPSLEVFFSILEVLGCTPKEFFDDEGQQQKVIYRKEEGNEFEDPEKGYLLKWLVPESNEKVMEPVELIFKKNGSFKQFPPSKAETFVIVKEGRLCLELGKSRYYADKGDVLYFRADKKHQLFNDADEESQALMVVTESYL